MISLVVATRNRAYTLRRVLPSFFEQDGINEIVLVVDASTDDTEEVFRSVSEEYPEKRAVLLVNSSRLGQPASRNRGSLAAQNEFILFCDDDEYLEAGYAESCRRILVARGAGIVAGRRVYMREGESPNDALARFGSGVRRAQPYNKHLCELVNGARWTGEIESPLVSPVMMTRSELLRPIGFDEHYGSGNGYREESDFQMRVFLSGHGVVMTNAVHSLHLPLSEVTTGGQRTGPLVKVRAMIRYNNYFYDKYYIDYAEVMRLRVPKASAKAMFGVYACYKVAIRPTLYRVATALLYSRMSRKPRV